MTTKHDEIVQPILEFLRSQVAAHPGLKLVVTMQQDGWFTSYGNVGCGCHACLYNAMLAATEAMQRQLEREDHHSMEVH